MNGESGLRERLARYRQYLRTEPALFEPIGDCLLEGCCENVQELLFLHAFAPTITAFVEWVLSSAKQRGLKRLYFLARDGWLWMQAAERIDCGKRETGTGEQDVSVKCPFLEIELRYLHVSRKTLYEGSEGVIAYLRQEGLFEEVPYGIVDSGWIGTTKKSLERLIGRRIEGFYFGIYSLPEGVAEDSFHCFYLRPYRDITRKAHFSPCLFEEVCSSPEGMTVGYEVHGELLVGSFLIPVFDKEKRTFVPIYDIENPNSAQLTRFSAILERYLDHYCGRLVRKETASVAKHRHGVTSEHGVDPLSSVDHDRPAKEAYGKDICGRAQKEENTIDIKGVTRALGKVLSLLMGNPTKEEAEALGGLLFDEGVEEKNLRSLAIRWTAEEVKAQRLLPRVRTKLSGGNTFRESGWQEASIVLSHQEMSDGEPHHTKEKIKRALREEHLYKGAGQLLKALRRMV